MKTCRQCSKPFEPARPLQAVCSPICASRKVKGDAKAKKAQERARTAQRREAIKPRAKWLSECQAIVNRIVRITSMARGDGCFTCGATPEQKFGGTYDAGHFRSVGAAPHLRFFMPQIRLQCITCNRHKSGNLLEFRRRLVEQKGAEWVEEIEANQGVLKPDVTYLKRFKTVMGRRLKRLEKRHG